MTQLHRLPSGGIVDRARPLRFVYDGNAYEGYAGDTVASALLANGVHLLARSFKYHRPRGIHTAARMTRCWVSMATGRLQATGARTLITR